MAAFARSRALTWSKGNHDSAKIVWDINLNRRTCSVSYMSVKPKNLSQRSGSVGNSAICRSVSHRSENYMVIYSMNWAFMQTKVHSHDANTFGWLEISRTRHGGGGGGGGGGNMQRTFVCVCVLWKFTCDSPSDNRERGTDGCMIWNSDSIIVFVCLVSPNQRGIWWLGMRQACMSNVDQQRYNVDITLYLKHCATINR